MPTTTPANACSAVEYGTDLSYEEFARKYLYPNKPVVLRGALRGWRALERWSPEFFRDHFGQFRFTIRRQGVRAGRHFAEAQNSRWPSSSAAC